MKRLALSLIAMSLSTAAQAAPTVRISTAKLAPGQTIPLSELIRITNNDSPFVFAYVFNEKNGVTFTGGTIANVSVFGQIMPGHFYTVAGSGIPYGFQSDYAPFSGGTVTAPTTGNGSFGYQVQWITPGTKNYDLQYAVSTPLLVDSGIVASNPITVDRDTLEKAYNLAVLTVDGTRDAVTTYTRNGGSLSAFIAEMGERITGSLSSTVSRIGGVINNVGLGLLEPDVQSGFSIFYQSVTDKNQDTNQLLGGKTQRDQLQGVLESLDQQGAPIQPQSTKDGISKFNNAVEKQKPQAFDPELAWGFDYQLESDDPSFFSFAVPTFGDVVNSYQLSIWQDGQWVYAGPVRGLQEYTFDDGVRRFKIEGIPPSLGIADHADDRWVTQLSFAESGRFTGSITALRNGTAAVPEPATWAMLLFGFGMIGASSRYRRRSTRISFA